MNSDTIQGDPEKIRAVAFQHGFELCNITSPNFSHQYSDQLDSWVEAGMYGEMGYMAEETRLEHRKDPTTMLDGIRSVITVGMRHSPPSYQLDKLNAAKGHGAIAAYAGGDDYHDIMKKRLKAFARDLDALLGAHDQRVYVDTAPVLEHALAESSGLGWQGKHTLTINRDHGSYLMLGEIFTTAEIEPDEAASFHCGSCTACIDICPTKAIVKPFVVDARLCISYLTIEYRGFIPRELRPLMGNRIFGCDDCQMICPWNQKLEAIELDQLKPREENTLPALESLFSLDEEQFRERFRKSPVKRTGRAGLLRNVAIAMGNSGMDEFIPPLIQALNDPEPLLRGHAAWALSRLYPHSKGGEIVTQLEYHTQHESDEDVLNELHQSLSDIGETS